MGKYLKEKEHNKLSQDQQVSYSNILFWLMNYDAKKSPSISFSDIVNKYVYTKDYTDDQYNHINNSLKDLPKMTNNSYENYINLVDYFNEYAQIIEYNSPKRTLGFSATSLMSKILSDNKELNTNVKNDKVNKEKYNSFNTDIINSKLNGSLKSLYNDYRNYYQKHMNRQKPKVWQFITRYRMKQEEKALKNMEYAIRSHNVSDELITKAKSNIELTDDKINELRNTDPDSLINKCAAVGVHEDTAKNMDYEEILKNYAPLYDKMKKLHESYAPYNEISKSRYSKEKEALETVKKFIEDHVEFEKGDTFDSEINKYKDEKSNIKIDDIEFVIYGNNYNNLNEKVLTTSMVQENTNDMVEKSQAEEKSI